MNVQTGKAILESDLAELNATNVRLLCDQGWFSQHRPRESPLKFLGISPRRSDRHGVVCGRENVSVPGEVCGENGRGPWWSTPWHLEAGTRCAYGGRIDF